MSKKQLTLGSLFDGSGGFPLAGMLAGIKPVWSSEISPFPILVTTKRLPEVRHYGNVSELSGADVEPVDVITFGSPCQDLSIAGKRAGIQDGERSNLFFQAIRVIKEMREATNGEKPRFIIWENVPGAFSSNGGEDFKAVLDAVVGLVEEDAASVPSPEKGKWPTADVLVGNGWSIAYRVLDAQFWGVPQRRKRIFLVGDLAGGRAADILSVSESLSGYSAEGFRTWQRAASGTEGCAGAPGGDGDDGLRYVINPQGCSGLTVTKDQTGTLVAQDHGNHPAVLEAAGFSTEHSAQSRSIGYEEEMSPTLRTAQVPATIALQSNPTDARLKISDQDISQTLTNRCGTGGNNTPLVAELEPVTLKIRCGKPGGGKGPIQQVNKSATLGTNNDQTLFQPTGSEESENKSYGISKEAYQGGENANFNFAVNEEVSPTLQAAAPNAVAKPEADVTEADGSEADAPEAATPKPRVFGVCSKKSHSMLSDNPHSGFYEAETTRTLDQNGGRPECSQGGVCVVEPIVETYDVRITSDGTKNARAHCYKTDISRCLDTSEGSPDSNHGGIAVVAFTQNQREEVRALGEKSGALAAQPGAKQQTYVLQGSMIGRKEKNGPQGDGINEDVSFTLNVADRHAIAAPVDSEDELEAAQEPSSDEATYCATTGSFMTSSKEKTQTLMARDYKDPQIINDVRSTEPSYIVRRLTPTECARLQGFPDWWCADLAIPEPTDEQIAFWMDVWETWRKATNPKGKPKTERQIRKWLASPYSTAAEYSLWGNGISLPIVYFIMAGIVWAAGLPLFPDNWNADTAGTAEAKDADT